MDAVSYEFLKEEIESIRELMERFVKNSGVELAVLSDDGGRLIAYAPHLEHLKPISLRSAVISAAVDGALEYLENFVDRGRTLYVAGQSRSVYMVKSEHSFILFSSFSNRIPVGSVKLFSEKLMREISPILERARSRKGTPKVVKLEDIAL